MVETVMGLTDLQIKLFTAVGQLALAGMVAFVALQQLHTARNKLKADLFDRRLALYDRFMKLAQDVFTGDADHANVELRMMLGDMHWAFGPKVTNKLKSKGGLLARLSDVGLAKAELEGLEGSDRKTQVLKLYELREAALEHMRGARDMFSPYLRLEH